VSAVKTAGEALAIAQFACTVGTCFPLACAIVCVPVEVLATAYQVITIPLKCADAWDAQIDSAEIQAAYENARIVLGDLTAHDDRVVLKLDQQASSLATHNSSLAAHDTWVRAKLLEITGSGTALAEDLAAHDAWVRANMEKNNSDMKKLLFDMLGKLVANQNEIIKLLKTPEGRRPGWIRDGY